MDLYLKNAFSLIKIIDQSLIGTEECCGDSTVKNEKNVSFNPYYLAKVNVKTRIKKIALLVSLKQCRQQFNLFAKKVCSIRDIRLPYFAQDGTLPSKSFKKHYPLPRPQIYRADYHSFSRIQLTTSAILKSILYQQTI